MAQATAASSATAAATPAKAGDQKDVKLNGGSGGSAGSGGAAAAAAAAAVSGGGKAAPLDDFPPTSDFVDPMLTDMYQISMAYGYWKTGRHEESSVFDLFFRQNPFHGEFTIFAGLEEVLRYVNSFHFKIEDIELLRSKFADWDPTFWSWLAGLDTSKVKIFAIPEGTIVFPREPLLRIEGPLAVCQLLETTALVLVNYASLLCTNAARHRLAVGPKKKLLEFGLRRAQGPDGAMSASRYAFVGGFDGTSNVKAGLMFGIPISGTHAHSFVTSFTTTQELKTKMLYSKTEKKDVDFVEMVLKYQQKWKRMGTNKGELAAFIAYAQSFPQGMLALVDTYDTLESGLWNYIFVALGLHACGYQAQGIRLDSGDLAYLSQECRKAFLKVEAEEKVEGFGRQMIVASNDLSEEVLWALKEQKHEVDCFGIGTNLVTCKTQPALGCVYKLVEVRGQPRIKISQDPVKVTIPGRKECYRLFNAKGEPVIDLLLMVESNAPTPQKRILCRHPFDANKRCYVTPSKVVPLHECVWDGKLVKPFPPLHQLRQRVMEQLAVMRTDFLRRVNPTPYKISLSSELYTFMHDLWLAEMPIAEIT